jgi:hypothetical protein
MPGGRYGAGENRTLRKKMSLRELQAVFLVSGCTLTAAFAGETASGKAASPEAAARVQVTLLSASGAPLTGEGFVVFKSLSSAGNVVVPAKLPQPALAEIPHGSQWMVIADFPGYFAADSLLQIPREPSDGPLQVKVSLRPAGTLTGRFSVEGKEKLPSSLEARFEATREGSSKKQDLPAGVATCATGATGEWRCRVPAGRLDIALHAKGFVPHYLWNVPVTAGKTDSLGSLKLAPGASVVGWIAHEDGTPAEKCRVRMEPATAPGPGNDPVLQFLRTVAGEVPCQKNGFFQFTGVAAGAYALVAREAEARAQMSPVQVWSGAESRISVPIVLRRPADLEVAISPPTDWLGRPWRLEARRANEYRAGWEERSFRAEATLDGRVKIAQQPPGRFWITVYDQLGNQIFSDTQADLSQSAQPYPITLDLLWVEGRVRIGGEPVSGRLFFGGRSGSTLIEMVSDGKGHFEGPLPKAGYWRVDIEADKPSLKTSARTEVKAKGSRASVSIELPDNKVFGRVVDPSGNAARNAEVTLTSMLGSMLTYADDKGEFDFRAFPNGATQLAAQASGAGHEVSGTYRFEASGASPHGPVVLTLQRNRSLRGRVLAATGPVIGATVGARALGGGGSLLTARSGFDGRFQLEIPEEAQILQAIVSPPGGALKAYEVDVSSGADLLLQVEPSGGDVVVRLGKETGSDDRILAVWQDEIGIPFGTLAQWTEGHGVRFWQAGQYHLSQLAPGQYTVCLGAAAPSSPGESDAWKRQSSCASGYLAPGGTLDLRLP